MKKILDGQSRRVGAIFNEVDLNFIDVANAIVRLADPDYVVKGIADAGNEPSVPVNNDCWVVPEDGTFWDVEAEKNDLLVWLDDAWYKVGYKLTEISVSNIKISTPYGMQATTIQEFIDEIAAFLYGEGSGSGSASASGV